MSRAIDVTNGHDALSAKALLVSKYTHNTTIRTAQLAYH